MENLKLFTSESVTEGHPDKVSDQISDAILDAILAEDPEARVACETLVTTDLVVISGEITTRCHPDYEAIIRNTIKSIGYSKGYDGFDADTVKILLYIDKQSVDIGQGVDETSDKLQGAGDQGLMFGFACNETPELMPLPIQLSHKLVERLSKLRHNGTLPWLQPDGKSQVTVEYNGYKPTRVTKVVIATQHKDLTTDLDSGVDELDYIKGEIVNNVILPVLDKYDIPYENEFIVNGTGRFVDGGPKADTGLTGRKIIVDTYGGYARHGGGAFSGKDPSKVDRSAAYMSRYISKNIVASGIAERCEVQLAYSIGVAEPVSINIDTFGSGKIDDKKITNVVENLFDLRPSSMIKKLELKRPIYRKTASYGHMGRDGMSWEETDMVNKIKESINNG